MNALINIINALIDIEPAGNIRTIARQALSYVADGQLDFAERLLCLVHERSTIDWAPALYEFIVSTVV